VDARWNGVLGIGYVGRGIDTEWGRAYYYTADATRFGSHLRRGSNGSVSAVLTAAPRDPRHFVVALDNGYTLRLTATEEPCEIRRMVLEGQWRFID
jgi:hypothetical protein